MHRSKRKALLLTCLILTAAALIIWYWQYQKNLQREPVANASFVFKENKQEDSI